LEKSFAIAFYSFSISTIRAFCIRASIQMSNF
jgi:hypothetical protein